VAVAPLSGSSRKSNPPPPPQGLQLMYKLILKVIAFAGARGTSRLTVLAPQRGGDERAAMTVP
jgi:hypothetical protein